MLSLSIVTLMATVLAGAAAAAPAEVKAVPAKEATAGTSSILAANVQFEVCRAINFNDCGIFLAEEFQCCKRPLVLKVFIKNCLVWSCNRVADAKYCTSRQPRRYHLGQVALLSQNPDSGLLVLHLAVS